MSTRATYEFNDVGLAGGNPQPTTIYIHYDGYPAGAASYFWAMLARPSKGNGATQFIRANEHAEITSSHSAHGDTEYQYTLDGIGFNSHLTAWAIIDRHSKTERNPVKRVIFEGPLYEFLNAQTKYIADPEACGDTPVYDAPKLIEYPYSLRPVWHNTTTARYELEKKWGILSHLNTWRTNGHTRGGNWDSMTGQLKTLVAAFPKLLELVPTTREFLDADFINSLHVEPSEMKTPVMTVDVLPQGWDHV